MFNFDWVLLVFKQFSHFQRSVWLSFPTVGSVAKGPAEKRAPKGPGRVLLVPGRLGATLLPGLVLRLGRGWWSAVALARSRGWWCPWVPDFY